MQGEMGAPPPPEHADLGGKVVSGVTATRWADGSMLIAGINHNSQVVVKRFNGTTRKWGIWWPPTGNVKAVGPPGLVSWGESFGQLFYATADGHVHEIGTQDKGKTWN